MNSKISYLITFSIAFMISLASTTMNKNSISFTDILLAVVFGFIIATFDYMRKNPRPYPKDDDKKRK